MSDKRPLVIGTAGGPAEIASGDTVPVAAGGTGATTAGGALTALGIQALLIQAELLAAIRLGAF